MADRIDQDLDAPEPDLPDDAAAEAPPPTRSAPRRDHRAAAVNDQVRSATRRAGDAERRAEEAERRLAEREAAAEARIAAVEARAIHDVLGEDGVAIWNELADLTESDPVAAAQRFAEVLARRAAEEPDETREDVPPPQPRPARVRQLDAAAPLTARGDEAEAAYLAARAKEYEDAVDRNQRKERLSTRERGDALMAYLEVGYHKALRARREEGAGY